MKKRKTWHRIVLRTICQRLELNDLPDRNNNEGVCELL